MTEIETFANGSQAGVALRPLDMIDGVAPVSCFWAAFNGAVVGVLAQGAVDRVVAYYNGKHYTADDVAAADAPLANADLSAHELLGLRASHV